MGFVIGVHDVAIEFKGYKLLHVCAPAASLEPLAEPVLRKSISTLEYMYQD
jgi:hypothetical protein